MQKPNEDHGDNDNEKENEETHSTGGISENKGTDDNQTQKETVDEETENQGDNIMWKTNKNVTQETESNGHDIMQKCTATTTALLKSVLNQEWSLQAQEDPPGIEILL